MHLTKQQLKKIIIDELRNVLKEFKMPDIDIDIPNEEATSEIELTIQPDIKGAQAAILQQFGIPQR